MSGNDNDAFHTNFSSFTAFLGGITFTVLVLLIQSKEKFLYSDWLIPIAAITGFLLILATLGRVVIVGNAKRGENFDKVLAVFALIGFFGLALMIPFFILPFNLVATIAVVIIEIVSFVVMVSRF